MIYVGQVCLFTTKHYTPHLHPPPLRRVIIAQRTGHPMAVAAPHLSVVRRSFSGVIVGDRGQVLVEPQGPSLGELLRPETLPLRAEVGTSW